MAYWIRSDSSIQADPMLWELAETLEISEAEAIGHLHLFWWWAVETLPTEGDISDCSPRVIARAAGWTGDATKFYTALSDFGWILADGDAIKIARWEQIGKSREIARKDKERKSKSIFEEHPQKFRGNSAETPRKDCGKPSEFRESSDATKQNKTKQNITEQNEEEVPPKAEPAPVPFSEIMEKFNEICTSLPKVQKLTDARKTAIRRRWEDDAKKDINWFVRLFGKVRESDFLSGRNGRSWRADFDWILEPRNVTRILEGNYDQDRQQQQPTPEPATWTTAATPNENADHNSDQTERDEIRRLLARNKRNELAKAGGVQL